MLLCFVDVKHRPSHEAGSQPDSCVTPSIVLLGDGVSSSTTDALRVQFRFRAILYCTHV